MSAGAAPGAASFDGSSSLAWRSEEDYYLARLAVRFGFMTEAEVPHALLLQGQMLAAGQPLTLGQLLLREGRLHPAMAVQLQHELARCFHLCAACNAGNWHAPGPAPRQEPCRRCGAPLLVAAAGSSLSQSHLDRRFSAVDHATARFRGSEPVLAMSGEQGPRLFAHYVIESELARGGMGAVYRVRHAETGQTFALKVLLAADKASEGQIHRFKREARAQMELGDHPHIVKIHEAGEWEGILYAVMDLVEGGADLGTTKAAMSRDERVGCLAKVARAVHHAHSHGYVHRDLKPANILLTRDHQPLVTDFGLAKNLDGETKLTRDGAAMGTPFYMAPEQAVGDVSKMGPPSDVYALGVILYELLCGDVPFRADSTLELYRMILELKPVSFAEHGVPEPALELICFKAMQKDPALRYADAGAFATDLERVLAGEKPLASQVSSVEKMARQVEEHSRSIGVILTTVVVGLLVIVLALVGFRAALKHHRAAQARAEREQAALGAIASLERATTDLATLPPREALRGLDEALAAAQALADGPLDARANLSRAWAAGLLARVGAGLRWGAGREARAGLERLERAAELTKDAPDAAVERDAARLRARCLWRLGRAQEARAAIGASPDPQAALLRALDEGLEQGKPERALERLSAAPDTPERRFVEARLLLALGREGEANRALQAAWKAQPKLRLEWARALLAAGRPGEAFELSLALLRDEPAELPAARLIAALAEGLGRDHEALLALQRALKRQPTLGALNGLALRLRARLGEDVTKLAASGQDPELALLRADLALLRGERPDAGEDPVMLASVAATTSEALPAPIAALLEDVPHDEPPEPELARALRRAALAYARRGQAAPAYALAEASWRGLQDADSALVLCRCAPNAETRQAARKRATEALRRELRGVQGPLARGLLLARWRRGFCAEGDESAASYAQREARALLTARRLGGCEVPQVDRELALLAGQPDPGLGGLLDWAEVLPRLQRPLRSEVTLDQRQVADAMAFEGRKISRNKAELALDYALRALQLDPYDPVAVYEAGQRREQFTGPTVLSSALPRLRGLPHLTGYEVMRIRSKWVRGFLGVATSPTDVLQKQDQALPDYLRPADQEATRVVFHYLGDLYPGDQKPPWPRTDRAALRAMVGECLRQDPLYVGLLYLHAHVAALEGLGPMAQRDLALLQGVLDPKQPNMDGGPVRYADRLERAWILAPIDGAEAGRLIADLPDLQRFGDDERMLFNDWIDNGPGLDGLRRQPSWASFVKVVRK
ncbi:MAG: protein kinase [Planctomycetota bacterium]